MRLLGAGSLLLLSTMLSALLRRKRYKLRRALVDLVIFSGVGGLGLALSFAVRIYYYLHGAINNWLIANVGSLSNDLRVPVDIKSFVPLDIPTFVTVPWIDVSNDASGRGNFWNYLLRSSLSGEFSFPGTLHRVLAIAWGIVLLALCFAALHRFANGGARRWGPVLYRQRAWLLLTLLWIASVAALRIQAPFSCSNDFRYVLPMLVPVILYWSGGGRATKILLMLMALLSAAFFVTL